MLFVLLFVAGLATLYYMLREVAIATMEIDRLLAALVLFNRVDRAGVGMIQGGRSPRLALEALQQLAVHV